MGFEQGFYILKHPEKYFGDPNKVRYMSSWELEAHKFLDNDPRVIKWSSETIAIPYLKPTDRRVHKYYPDYFVQYKDAKGKIHNEIIEVKPYRETRPPKSKSTKTRIQEDITWAINLAKWSAAQKYCNKYGIRFRLLTEKEIYR